MTKLRSLNGWGNGFTSPPLIHRPPSKISKLLKKPPGQQRAHPALQNMNFSGSGSTETDHCGKIDVPVVLCELLLSYWKILNRTPRKSMLSRPVLRIHDILVRIRIHASDKWIRILLFSSFANKKQIKKFFCLLLFEGTFTSLFK